MSNMSYCRFQNTLQDLHDCNDNFFDLDEEEDKEEVRARKFLVGVCKEIVEQSEYI